MVFRYLFGIRVDKILVTLFLLGLALNSTTVLVGILTFGGTWPVTIYLALPVFVALIPLLWVRKRKRYLIAYGVYLLCLITLLVVQVSIDVYRDSITIDTAPAINTNEYLPFEEDSKIVKIDSELLDFSEVPKEDLPIIDGAAALFPVYSAFVHAVYPESTELDDGVFVYQNTVAGYEALAKRETDIFIGAAPSKEQIAQAVRHGTTFRYTHIGSEAFVFFVHRDNPITSLTTEEIKGIYSGKITNWKELGGKDEPIAPFQRNEGSGSQSMLIRFMDGTPLIEPEMETSSDGMGDIIQKVADYKSKSGSMGFSFRFYVEGIIKNPDIKMLAVDGVAPTEENIRSGAYPVITPIYAVTYAGNKNENVTKLIDWMLSEEGQYIIEETGYVGVGK